MLQLDACTILIFVLLVEFGPIACCLRGWIGTFECVNVGDSIGEVARCGVYRLPGSRVSFLLVH